MNRRESGSMLIEVIIAMSVLTVGILGFFSAFVSTARATGEVAERDEVRVALENLVETLRREDFDQLYTQYHYAWLEVPTLQWSGGSPAFAYVIFYTDETYIPSVFGPVTDIDGDPATESTDCTTTYKILPTRVLLFYRTRDAEEYKVHQLFLTLGPL